MKNNSHSLGVSLIKIIKDFVQLAKCEKDPRFVYLSLEDELYAFYNQFTRSIIREFTESKGSKLLFSTDATSTIPPAMLGKKCSLYSCANLCLFEGNVVGFLEFCLQLEPLIKGGKLFPILTFNKNKFKEYRNQRTEKLILEKIIRLYSKDTNAVPVFGSNRALLEQFAESPELNAKSALSNNRILLPTLEGVELYQMMEIFEEYEDPTLLFRNKFKELVSIGDPSRNEEHFFEALTEVDLEVRKLDQLFKEIRNEKFLQNAKTAVGSIVILVSIIAPNTTTLNNLITVFGSISVFDGIRNSAFPNAKEQNLKTNPFYTPWLIHNNK